MYVNIFKQQRQGIKKIFINIICHFLPVLEANKKNCDHAGIILFILFFIFCRPDIVCSAKYTFNWLKVVE